MISLLFFIFIQFVFFFHFNINYNKHHNIMTGWKKKMEI